MTTKLVTLGGAPGGAASSRAMPGGAASSRATNEQSKARQDAAPPIAHIPRSEAKSRSDALAGVQDAAPPNAPPITPPMAPKDGYLNLSDEIAAGRHHLPHWEQNETICFATFRQADSLPQSKLKKLQEAKEDFEKLHPKPWSDETIAEYYDLFGQKIDTWLDSGAGSCVLENAKARKIVEDALLYFNGERYILYAFVVMPNHVHVLFKPLSTHTVSSILHSWKSFTSNAINKEMGLSETFWQKETFDRYIRNQNHFNATVEYIKHNFEMMGGAASSRATIWLTDVTKEGSSGGALGGAASSRAMPGGAASSRATNEQSKARQDAAPPMARQDAAPPMARQDAAPPMARQDAAPPNLKEKTMIKLVTASVVGFCAALVAQAGSPYVQHVEWALRPIVVADTNAAQTVRNQHDFTVPLHGPWLTNPAADGMSVTWITRTRCGAAIDYRKKGTEAWTRQWLHITGGLIDYTKDLHTAHLTGLEPNTDYEYRLVSNQDRNTTAYHGDVLEGREIYSFRTINPAKEKYKTFLTCDLHGTARLTLDPMIARSQAEDADFYFFAGDNVEDNMNDIRYYTTFGFLDDITRKWGSRKPSIFMRGNHDANGQQMYQYADYFAQRDGKTYQAFRQGPVLWIVLDTVHILKHKTQADQIQRYWDEQTAWLKELKKTADWKESKFRVVLSHFAPFATAQTVPCFNEALCDDSPDGRIHLYFAGHVHCYYRINAGTKEFRIGNEKGDLDLKHYPTKFVKRFIKKKTIPDNIPYPLVVGSQCEAMTIDVSNEKLVVKSHAWKREAGGLNDAFEIYPDGTLKDLIPVVVVPAQDEFKKEKNK